MSDELRLREHVRALRHALEAAEHALATRQGLHAFDAACPAETFVCDDAATLALIEATLKVTAP